ncbi:MAG: UDP-N-acetylmuramate dehydrogenase [Saccharofermentans sp.]|nr:UDP-N-acetylmuramate dehydrogenase [Mageeibacillus sp.]MCI1263514.1 UDP-N-acetylmuramate dehydrogenase [Saccharofermentans sp.]MCI1275118.1 UDP-N-acetylmuramate dehydrogenase [Saccharofermentans sp.]MCI2044148.1 UDP-N-acetylmuramate dehydrogenase [Mageeibacillus sp.]
MKPELSRDVSLKQFTTFRCGGEAKLFAEPKTEDEVAELLDYARSECLRTFVMGQGSNILVSDKGFDGLVIRIGRQLGAISSMIDGSGMTVSAGAGAPMSLLGNTAARQGLTGAEFMCGIPGSVGGGVFMNAGAYGDSLSDIAVNVRYSDGEKILTRTVNECGFGYRTSLFEKMDRDGRTAVILGLTVKLDKENQETIDERIAQLREKRAASQPLDIPSAGSTFKRPEGYFAGKLIEDSGLRGFKLDDSGAQVSPKHCGFIVNNGGRAKSADILRLIDYVVATVYEKQGVMLEREVRLIGEF